MTQSTFETSVRDLALTLFRRKWGIMGIILVTMVSSVVYLEMIRSTLHVTSAKLLVKLGQEQARPPTMLGETSMIVTQRFQEINSEIEILMSNDLLGQVVDDLNMDQPSPPGPVPERLLPRLKYHARRYVSGAKEWVRETMIRVGLRERLSAREAAILGLKRRLLVTAGNDSNVILVQFLSPVRQGAGMILNRILEKYLLFRRQVYQDPGAVAFFTEQTQESQSALEALEARLEAFEIDGGIRLLNEQKSLLLRQIADARSAALAARLDRDEAQSKVERLEQILKEADPDFALLGAFAQGSFPESLQQALVALRKHREQLRVTELDDGLVIQNDRAQFDVIMTMLASHLRSVLREREAALEVREGTLEDRQESLAALHAKEREWGNLKRWVGLQQDAFLFNNKKLDEAVAVTAMEAAKLGNVAIIERAIDPLERAGTRKLTLLGLSALLAVFAALAWAAIAEFFDHRIYSAEELEQHLGAPVAGVVPTERSVEIWRR